MGAAMAISACGSSRSAFAVELLEDEVAQVVDLDSGRAVNLRRAQLPRGAREGDVIVDGRIDKALSAELRREVEALHQRYAVPLPAGFSLEDELPRPLTEEQE